MATTPRLFSTHMLWPALISPATIVAGHIVPHCGMPHSNAACYAASGGRHWAFRAFLRAPTAWGSQQRSEPKCCIAPLIPFGPSPLISPICSPSPLFTHLFCPPSPVSPSFSPYTLHLHVLSPRFGVYLPFFCSFLSPNHPLLPLPCGLSSLSPAAHIRPHLYPSDKLYQPPMLLSAMV